MSSSSETDTSSSDDEFLQALAEAEKNAVKDNETEPISFEPPRTKNETLPSSLNDSPLELPPNPSFLPLGTTYSFVENVLVIKGFPHGSTISADAIAVWRGQSSTIPLGKIYDVFGPVEAPYYAVYVPNSVERSQWKDHDTVINVVESSFTPIDVHKLTSLRDATDASGLHDEAAMIPEFSDDEEELEWKQSQKQLRRKTQEKTSEFDFYVIPSRT
ncbi:hypothetical protein GEMRC1_009937 [Eukaryota sp. GEM-RC1]